MKKEKKDERLYVHRRSAYRQCNYNRASLRNFKVKELRNIRGTREISEFLCIVSIQTSLVSRNTKENANIARIEKKEIHKRNMKSRYFFSKMQVS